MILDLDRDQYDAKDPEVKQSVQRPQLTSSVGMKRYRPAVECERG